MYDVNLVDGKKENDDDNYHCSTARSFDHLCGLKGKYYEPKYDAKYDHDNKNIDEFDFETFIQFL